MQKKVEYKKIPASLFRSIIARLPICTVDIVILSPNRKYALVGRRINQPAKSSWFTVGGRLLKHETFTHAAIRLLQKELAMKVNPQQLQFIGIQNEIFPQSAFGKTTTHNVNIFFQLITKQKKFAIDSQHDQVDWLPVRSSKLHPLARKKIDLALR